jgi:serine/threonine protein kinase
MDMFNPNNEWTTDYARGELHPVHLGDRLGDRGQYRVVHKLGKGGYAAVWLCEDTESSPKWKAVKINVASKSTEDCADLKVKCPFEQAGVKPEEAAANGVVIPSDYFWIDGPNGRHLCTAMPLLGGHLQGVGNTLRYEETPLKDICYQIVQAMQFLHSKQVCHGDFRPANILYQLDDSINELSEEEMLELMGKPQEYFIYNRQTEEPFEGTFPKYCVLPAAIPQNSQYTSKKIAVVDFSVSFPVSEPPSKWTGIPLEYAAPEFFFGGGAEIGFGSDIWSLGATLCEVRRGFTPAGVWEVEDLQGFENMSGPMPASMAAAYQELVAQDEDDDEEDEEESEDEEDIEDMKPGRLRRNFLRPHKFYAKLREGEQRRAVSQDPEDDDDEDPAGYIKVTAQMSEEEAAVLYDLMQLIFKWAPEDRPLPEVIMDHPWFDGCEKGPQKADDSALDQETGSKTLVFFPFFRPGRSLLEVASAWFRVLRGA